MKKLEISQMENLQGSISQRNCSILGLTIVGGFISGFFTGGTGWYFAAGSVSAAAAADCF